MAARPEQDAMRRNEKKKSAPLLGTSLPRSAQEIDAFIQGLHSEALALKILLAEIRESHFDSRADKEFFERAASRSPNQASVSEAGGVALWDGAIESLGRSARVLVELAESTGEAIARITARGDRIDRIQKETRALLNTLVAPESDA
ncbi:MAG: hypothetical protein L0Y57_12955 [Beijerinckiaceae bacterium]|nr:hypothetical protein [Beijerinckiaceae bacterium]